MARALPVERPDAVRSPPAPRRLRVHLPAVGIPDPQDAAIHVEREDGVNRRAEGDRHPLGGERLAIHLQGGDQLAIALDVFSRQFAHGSFVQGMQSMCLATVEKKTS